MPDPPTQTTPSLPHAPHHILVAFDASDQARYALDTAIPLAQAAGARLTLLHVFVEPSVPRPEYRLLLDPATRAALLQAEQDRLDHAKSLVPPGVPTDTLLRQGDPATEILLAAADLPADLIALGTHGRGRIAHAFLGSVANAIIRQAPCPVLTVSHPPTPTPRT